jgi:hypothetical protein
MFNTSAFIREQLAVNPSTTAKDVWEALPKTKKLALKKTSFQCAFYQLKKKITTPKKVTKSVNYISQKPPFTDLVKLQSMVDSISGAIRALADESDTPQRATDLHVMVQNLSSEVKGVILE